ncbi:hypothetical protein H0H93_005836 [Arthromyces matolae]|nr:hypothetical protein H0H93_005836 [Arthromyces matolae]
MYVEMSYPSAGSLPVNVDGGVVGALAARFVDVVEAEVDVEVLVVVEIDVVDVDALVVVADVEEGAEAVDDDDVVAGMDELWIH